jgi:regulator of sigma E protease
LFFLTGLLFVLLLITVHECGHLLVAKLCGMPVISFSIGFGPRLLRFRYGDTTYYLSLLPLGGYVRLYCSAGAMEKEGNADTIKDTTSTAQRLLQKCYALFLPTSFEERESVRAAFAAGRKTVDDFAAWKRFAVLVAGLTANMIFATLLTFLLLLSRPQIETLRSPLTIQIESANSGAARQGLLSGDILIAINRAPVREINSLLEVIETIPAEGAIVTMTVLRHNAPLDITLKIPAVRSSVRLQGLDSLLTLGLQFERKIISITAIESLRASFVIQPYMFASVITSILYLDYQRHNAEDEHGVFEDISETGALLHSSDMPKIISQLWTWTVLLVLINLFPCPATDGGMMLLLFCERVLHFKPNDNLILTLNRAILVLFLIFAIYGPVRDLLFKVLDRIAS